MTEGVPNVKVDVFKDSPSTWPYNTLQDQA